MTATAPSRSAPAPANPGTGREPGRARVGEWALNKSDIRAVLSIAEERELPLSVRLFNRAGRQEVDGQSFTVTADDHQVEVKGRDWRASLDLRQVESVRAVSRCFAGRTRLALECVDCEARCLLSLTGPSPEQEPGGQIWCALLARLEA
ncbi:MAG: hypothetical protein ACPGU7_09895 [Gammaproteobacteria bacterium]